MNKNTLYVIDFKNRESEEFESTNSFYNAFKLLTEQNKLSDILKCYNVCSGLMYPMSDYSISRTLNKGKNVENGYIIKKNESNKVSYVSDVGFVSDYIWFSLFFSEEQANSHLDYLAGLGYKNLNSYSLVPMTKEEHDNFIRNS